jgi:predicted TIM-barrel fold metal-dependent hydrolase
MQLTRRQLLRGLSAVPLATAGCCTRDYPVAKTTARDSGWAVSAALRPAAGTAGRSLTGPVIDVHAHFFNASDVPVRGFLAECIGHSAPPALRRLLELAAPLADVLARRAPTAAEELDILRSFAEQSRGRDARNTRQAFDGLMGRERAAAASRVAEALRGSELERELLRMKAPPRQRSARVGTLSSGEVLDVIEQTRVPSSPAARRSAARAESFADVADGFIGFLSYMLSLRSSNLDVYTNAFSTHEHAFGVTQVLGALVDFDYWIDCPPLSSQEHQLEVHAALARMHGDYFRPVIGYNPWTDINQGGAGRDRVRRAVTDHGFVAVKIYPPIGFLPAGNADNPPPTLKKRPDLAQLDAVLDDFFEMCAGLPVPVMAHAARSNGRDYAHDEFGGPPGWRARLERAAARGGVPPVNLGHFGGGSGSTWTQDFAGLMRDMPAHPLFGDLGYWEELMCPSVPDDTCRAARRRLQRALEVAVGDGTVADRVMFGTDWLMLSQVKGWPDYPALVHESVQQISGPGDPERIFGLNAQRCFPRLRAAPPS